MAHFFLILNFANKILENLSANADKKIIIWPDDSYTSSKVLLNKVIEYRQKLPQKYESVIIAENLNENTIALIISCIANGNPIMFYPKHLRFFRLIKILKEKNVSYFFSNNFFLKNLLSLYNITALHINNLSKDFQSTISSAINNVENQHIALYSFSSGSSGEVKCIDRSHQLLINQVEAINKSFDKYKSYTDLSIFPNVLLYNLYENRTCVIPDIRKFDLLNLKPEKIFNQIIQHKIESITGNKFFFNELSKNNSDKKFKDVKAIGIGGSPIDNRLIDRISNIFPNAEINIIYGSTESEPISVNKIYLEETKPTLMGYCVGQIHEFIQIKFSETKNVEILGNKLTIGEICVIGRHVKNTNQEYLKTGDWGYLYKNELYITARKGNTEFYHQYQHLCIEHVLINNFQSEFAVIIKNNLLIIYTESKLSKQDIEMVLFINFNIQFNVRIVYAKIIKDNRQLSKTLYNKLDEVRI